MRVLAALLLCGCASGSFEKRPGQNVAERLIWRELYEEDGDPPPCEWIDGLVLEPDKTGLTLPGWKIQVSKSDLRTSVGGAPEIDRLFSNTKYAHELMHYRTWKRTGDIDPAHWRGDWQLADETARHVLWDAGL